MSFLLRVTVCDVVRECSTCTHFLVRCSGKSRYMGLLLTAFHKYCEGQRRAVMIKLLGKSDDVPYDTTVSVVPCMNVPFFINLPMVRITDEKGNSLEIYIAGKDYASLTRAISVLSPVLKMFFMLLEGRKFSPTEVVLADRATSKDPLKITLGMLAKKKSGLLEMDAAGVFFLIEVEYR